VRLWQIGQTERFFINIMVIIKYIKVRDNLLVKEEEPQPTMKSKFNEPPLNEREIVGYGYLDVNIY